MSKKTLTYVAMLVIAAFVVPAGAAQIGFEVGEGYAVGNLDQQPGGAGPGNWSAHKVGFVTNAQVVAGVGVGGSAGAVLGYSTGSYTWRYSYIVSLADIGGGPFSNSSSVINYGWKFRDGDLAMTTYWQAGEKNEGKMPWQIRYSGLGGDRVGIYRAAGTTEAFLNMNLTWHSIDIISDWSSGTFNVTVDGVNQGNFTMIDATGIEYRFYAAAQGNFPSNISAYMDDVYVTPEPATMGLLALGGLALLRRKRR